MISKHGIHSALIIHNFLNMPHVPVCSFVEEWLLTLLGVLLVKKVHKFSESIYPSFSNNPLFLHYPFFEKAYICICAYMYACMNFQMIFIEMYLEMIFFFFFVSVLKSIYKIIQEYVLDDQLITLVAILKFINKIFQKQLQRNPFSR